MLRFIVLVAIFSTAYTEDEQVVNILNWSNKTLKSLEEFDCQKYPRLEQFDLSNNELTGIDEHTFETCTNLKRLNLSGNPDLVLPQYSTLVISDIEELDLSNCNIHHVPENLFDGTSELKTLHLDRNPLKHLDVYPLANINKLEKVIVPNISKESIEAICEELNSLIIEVHRKKGVKLVQCSEIDLGVVEDVLEEGDNRKREIDKDGTTIQPPSEETPTTVTDDQMEIANSTEPTEKVQEITTLHVQVRPRIEQVSSVSTIDPSNVTESPAIEENLTENGTVAIASVPLEVPIEVDSNRTEIKEHPIESNTEIQTKIVPVTDGEEVPKNISSTPLRKKVSVQVKMSEEVADLTKPIDISEKAQPSQSVKPANAGSNILIGLVVAVIILGVVAFAYKFYKTRHYRTARTCEEEPPARELEEIKVHDKKPMAEEEPLMNQNCDGSRKNNSEEPKKNGLPSNGVDSSNKTKEEQ